MRKWLAMAGFLAVISASGTALSQTESFGKSGTMVFGAERVFALFYKGSIKFEDGQKREHTHSYSGVGFAWGANSPYDPFNTPRIGFDYFVTDAVSVGGSVAYAKLDDDDGGSDYEQYLIAPRGGYWIPIGRVVGLWPRGGLTYHNRDPDGDNNNESGLALSLEAMFAIAPVDHFAFLAGPTFDWDFIGTVQCTGAADREEDCDLKYRSYGLHVGVIGWF